MSQDNWEQIHYHQLPDWMKKVAEPEQRITSTRTKTFSGKPYDYKIEYTVNKDIVSITYWKSPHTKKPLKFRKPGILALVVLACILIAGAGYVVLPHFFVPDVPGIPPATTNNAPGANVTPVPGGNSTNTPSADPDARLLQSPRISSYYYFIENSRKSISLTTYGGLSDSLTDKRRASPPVSDKELIATLLENQDQDEYLQSLVESIAKRSPGPDDPAKIAVSLVQHIPYTRSQSFNASRDWSYPYETVYRNAGTSADKSLLAAYLLKELGYETVIFEYPGSMAVGVKCSPNYDFYDTGYAFIETTVPSIITYVPESRDGGFSVSANPHVIHVNEGKKAMDVSAEYRDASRLKQLERLGGVLDQSQNTELLKLLNKYDLQRSR